MGWLSSIACAAIAAACAACDGASPPIGPEAAVPVDASIDAALDAQVEACAPLVVEVPELAVTSKHDAPVPDIVDYGTSLDGFYRKLARLVRRERVTIRIGVYGDSNMANDRTLGFLRRQLQRTLGDAGHGWVSFGKPWGWYKHMDIEHGTAGTWQSYNLSNSHAPDFYYGFAGTAAESSEVGAIAWVATAKAQAPVGTAVTSFDVFYLARPSGGSFEVKIDGATREVIDTSAERPTLRFARYDVADGAHRLSVTVKSGRVRVYGVAVERDVPGVVVDSLGIGSLNPWLLAKMNPAMAEQGLARRGYDLVVETSGSNMCVAKWVKPSLEVWRRALPDAGYMLWSPPDAARFGVWTSEPLMRACSVEKRGVAEANAIAYWDLYAALGGFGSMPKWLADSRFENWVEPDGLHLGKRLNMYIAERFARMLFVQLARRAESDPRLGCSEKQQP